MDIKDEQKVVIEIKVPIAGRIYPLSIPPHLKNKVEDFSKKVNKTILEFETMYELSDKQDALALTLLDLFSKASISSPIDQGKRTEYYTHLSNRLSTIEHQLLSMVNDAEEEAVH